MKTAIVQESKKFKKEITLIRAHAILLKDEYGQVIYTFDSKSKADKFYKELKKSTPLKTKIKGEEKYGRNV